MRCDYHRSCDIIGLQFRTLQKKNGYPLAGRTVLPEQLMVPIYPRRLSIFLDLRPSSRIVLKNAPPEKGERSTSGEEGSTLFIGNA